MMIYIPFYPRKHIPKFPKTVSKQPEYGFNKIIILFTTLFSFHLLVCFYLFKVNMYESHIGSKYDTILQTPKRIHNFPFEIVLKQVFNENKFQMLLSKLSLKPYSYDIHYIDN